MNTCGFYVNFIAKEQQSVTEKHDRRKGHFHICPCPETFSTGSRVHFETPTQGELRCSAC